MDRLLHYGFYLWVVPLVLGFLGVLVLVLVRIAVWFLRRLPFFRHRLEPAATTMRSWGEGLQAGAAGWFWVAAALPLLAVAVPVVLLTTWLLRRLVPAADPETEPGHAGAPHGLREHFISLKSMDWPLRLVTAFAIAQVVASALVQLVVWMDKVPAAPVAVGQLNRAAVQVHPLVFVTSVVLLAVGWSLLLAGGWVTAATRYLLVAIFTATAWPGTSSSGAIALWLVCSVTLWLAALASGLPGRTPGAPPSRFVHRTIALGLGLGAYYASLGYVGATLTGAAGFPFLVNRQLTQLSIVLTPVLFLTGTDFAEIGLALGGVAEKLKRAWVAPLWGLGSAALAAGVVYQLKAVDYTGLETLLATSVTTAVVAGIFWFAAFAADRLTRGSWLSVALVVIAVVIIIWAAFETQGYVVAMLIVAVVAMLATRQVMQRVEPGGWPSITIPFAGVAVLALSLTATREIVVLVRAAWSFPPDAQEVAFAVRRDTLEVTRYSLAVPEEWPVRRTANGAVVHFGGDDLYAGGGVFLVSYGRDLDSVVNALLPDLPLIRFAREREDRSTDRSWTVDTARVYRNGKTYQLNAYHPGDAPRWALVSISGARYEDYFYQIVSKMIVSWRPDWGATAPAPVPAPDLARRATRVGGFGMVPVLFVIVGWILLFKYRRPGPFGRPRDRAALLAIAVGLTALLFLPDTSLVEVWKGTEAHANPLASLQLVAAGVTVLLTLYWVIRGEVAARQRIMRLLATLNIGLLVLLLVYWLYGIAIPLSEDSVPVQAVVLVVALLWDLLMSGKEITNVDGVLFRRPARVLIYLGYLTLVCTAVVFFSSQHLAGNGRQAAKFLEAEDVVRQGIIWLGTPLLLLNVLLGLARGEVRGGRRRGKRSLLTTR